MRLERVSSFLPPQIIPQAVNGRGIDNQRSNKHLGARPHRSVGLTLSVVPGDGQPNYGDDDDKHAEREQGEQSKLEFPARVEMSEEEERESEEHHVGEDIERRHDDQFDLSLDARP